MNSTENAYGLWSLVIINSLFFILFAFSFFKPQSRRDWRSFSLYSAFIVALFAEMYVFSADDLSACRLAADQIPWCGLFFP